MLDYITISGLSRSKKFEKIVKDELNDRIIEILTKAQDEVTDTDKHCVHVTADFFDSYIIIAGRAMEQMDLHDSCADTRLDGLSRRIYIAIDKVAQRLVYSNLGSQPVVLISMLHGILKFYILSQGEDVDDDLVFKSNVSYADSKY